MPAHARWTIGLTVVATVAFAAPFAGPASSAPATCEGKSATLVGTPGSEKLVGTSKRDVIVALAGDDVVDGRGGNDVICGGMGADRLTGGPGADRLFGGGDRLREDSGGAFLVGDVLTGGPGNDLLAGGHDSRNADQHRRPDTVSYRTAAGGVVVDLAADPAVATGAGADTIRVQQHFGVEGSPHADVITGSDGNDDIAGLGGDDRIDGRRGNDTIFGEDVRAESPGDDVLRGGLGADLIGSYAGRDTVHGGSQNDFVEAYSNQPTTVDGDEGDDYIAQNITPGSGSGSFGGLGFDKITFYGGLLADRKPRKVFTIDLRNGTTNVNTKPAATGTIGGFEAHRMVGNLGWIYQGSAKIDRVWAINGGPLQAWTFGANDWVHGSPRADFINTGNGVDMVIGDDGNDTCRHAEKGTC